MVGDVARIRNTRCAHAASVLGAENNVAKACLVHLAFWFVTVGRPRKYKGRDAQE